ncbi:MAG: deaminase [Ignavibacteria bacterium]|nr:deaminase [Ignavibacteria bacterium]
MKKKLFSKNVPPPIGPYSQAVSYNGLIYTSGQISIDNSGNVTSSDIESQTRTVLTNIQSLLNENNSGLGEVLKVTIYLKSMDEFAAMNKVYAEFFGTSLPARSTIEVSRLPKDVKVEIDAVAIQNN